MAISAREVEAACPGKLDQTLELKHRAGLVKLVRADLFPAYDEDGGLLACIAPHASAATFDD